MSIISNDLIGKITNLTNKRLAAKSTNWLGILLAVLAAVFTGSLNVVGKTLVDPQYADITSLNPINLALLLGLVTGLFFTPLSKNKKSITKFDKKTLIFILLLGITDVSAVSTYFFGLSQTTAVNASILSNTEIIFAAIIAIAIFREKLNKHEMLPISMILLGAIIFPVSVDLVGNNFSLNNMVIGDFIILLAAGFYAIDISIAKFVSKRAPATRITQLSAFAGVPFALLLIVVFQIPFDIQLHHIPGILFIGIFVTGFAYYFFILALRFIGAIRTILIYSTTTVFGVVFAGIFLGESISALDVTSLGIIGFGVFLLRNKLAKMEE